MKEIELIELYCLIEDSLQTLGHHDDQRCEFSEAEVVFTGIVAARYFSGNIRKARIFLKFNRYCPNMLSESRLNRRINRIYFWNDLLKILGNHDYHTVIDSFPIHSCRLSRANRRGLFQGRIFKGYNSSHKCYFIGIKVHLITSRTGRPFFFQITPANEHDLTALKFLDLPFESPCRLYGDKAYNDYDYEKELERKGVRLTPQRKENSRKKHSRRVGGWLYKYRKKIETAISGIVRLMPRWIQAVSMEGFETKIALFIVAYTTTLIN